MNVVKIIIDDETRLTFGGSLYLLIEANGVTIETISHANRKANFLSISGVEGPTIIELSEDQLKELGYIPIARYKAIYSFVQIVLELFGRLKEA